jgi:hypothetical protein
VVVLPTHPPTHPLNHLVVVLPTHPRTHSLPHLVVVLPVLLLLPLLLLVSGSLWVPAGACVAEAPGCEGGGSWGADPRDGQQEGEGLPIERGCLCSILYVACV